MKMVGFHPTWQPGLQDEEPAQPRASVGGETAAVRRVVLAAWGPRCFLGIYSGKSSFIVDLPIKNGDFPLSITGWWFQT